MAHCLDLFFPGCENGAVKLADNVPEVYWDGQWQFLCGECFNQTSNGTRKFCNVLGYETGKKLATESNVTNQEKTLFMGKCNCYCGKMFDCTPGLRIQCTNQNSTDNQNSTELISKSSC